MYCDVFDVVNIYLHVDFFVGKSALSGSKRLPPALRVELLAFSVLPCSENRCAQSTRSLLFVPANHVVLKDCDSRLRRFADERVNLNSKHDNHVNNF